jgi:hypothetical protein
MLSDHILDIVGKLSTRRRAASAWFHGVWTCHVEEVLEY